MYGIINSIHTRSSIEDILQDTVLILPTGYQYPEITRAKIVYNNREFKTLPFKETAWKQVCPLITQGEENGLVEVYYLKKQPEIDEGPFQKEERSLLNNITQAISAAVDKRLMEKNVHKLASLPEHNPNPVIETSLDGNITYANPSACQQFPQFTEQGMKHPILKDFKWIIEQFAQNPDQVITREIACNAKVYEQKISFLVEHSLTRIFIHEITAQKKREKQLHDLSMLDSLTGLYNRRGFLILVKQQLELADRSKKGFYLLFADLDRMKWINDTLGHHEGDLSLKTIALICRKTFRKSDIIARIGGDEFAICAVEARKDSIEQLMQRLRNNLSAYNKSHKTDINLSLSIGATYYDPKFPDTMDDLLKKADDLMYKQKNEIHSHQRIDLRTPIPDFSVTDIRDHLSTSSIIVLIISSDLPASKRIEALIKHEQNSDFRVHLARSLDEGYKQINTGDIDVVLLDLTQSENREISIIQNINAIAPNIPVIALATNDDLAVRTIRDGAQDCIIKDHVTDSMIIRSIKYAIERKYVEIELKNSFNKFLYVFEETINTLASIVEMRDPYSAGHQKRVSSLATSIAEKMGLSAEQQKAIKLAALIHDIGKTGVPEDILNKQQRLTDDEKKIIETHPEAGYEILKTIKFPWLITQIVHQHHERIDGTGYPNGLRNKDILVESKVLAVADVVEAMLSDRPYRPAPGLEKALEEIRNNKDTLYDAQVVQACLELFAKENFTFTS